MQVSVYKELKKQTNIGFIFTRTIFKRESKASFTHQQAARRSKFLSRELSVEEREFRVNWLLNY